MQVHQDPSQDYQAVLELLGRESVNGRISPLRWWAHTLKQELGSSALDFSSNDLKVESKWDFDLEWGESILGMPSDGSLAVCPLSNLLFDPSQTTTVRLSTIVQYMRVIKRNQPTSAKVQRLVRDAADLEHVPLPGMARAASYTATPVTRVRMDVEQLVRELVDGTHSTDSSNACKSLVDVIKRAIFGSQSAREHDLLQRVIEHVRFLNHEIPVFDRVALNCARVVLKSKAEDMCEDEQRSLPEKKVADAQRTDEIPRTMPDLAPRPRSRTGRRKSWSPTKRDAKRDYVADLQMRRHSVMPTNFVVNTRKPTVTEDDLVVLSNQGPKTITRYHRDSSSNASVPASVWAPANTLGAEEQYTSLTGDDMASMNWKLDELLRMRKERDDLTEERDKAVVLYQEAVGARKQAQRDCSRAFQEYARIETFLPVCLEGIQDIASAVACADSEARSQWRMITKIDSISQDMLTNLESLFDVCRNMASERLLLHESVISTHKKLQKYRKKLDASRADNEELSERLAETTERLVVSNQEMTTAAKEHAIQIQTMNGEFRAKITQHEALVANLKEAHATSVAELKDSHTKTCADTKRQHEETLANLRAEWAKEVADLTAKNANEVADLTSKNEREIADLNAKNAREVADLKTKLEYETQQHNMIVTKQQAEYEIVVADMKRDHDQEVGVLKDSWHLEVDELKAMFMRQIAEIKQQHAAERESAKLEHQVSI